MKNEDKLRPITDDVEIEVVKGEKKQQVTCPRCGNQFPQEDFSASKPCPHCGWPR